MNQRKRWKLAGICLATWLTVITISLALLTVGVMTFSMTACSEEPTMEWVSEEELEDLIFVK